MSLRFEMEGIDLERLHRYLRDTLHDKRCETAPPYVEVGLARHRAMRYAVEPLFVAGIESGELAEEDAEYFQAFAIPGKDGCMAMNCPELPAIPPPIKMISGSTAHATCASANPSLSHMT